MGIANKSLVCYLAGKMSGISFEEMNTWRVKAKHELIMAAESQDYKLVVINPVDYYNYEETIHQSEIEVQDFDLRLVTSSDFIVVDIKGLNSSIGTSIELHDAYYHHNIPVFAIGNVKEYNELHPWIKRCITRRETSIQDLVTYLNNFYFIS